MTVNNRTTPTITPTRTTQIQDTQQTQDLQQVNPAVVDTGNPGLTSTQEAGRRVSSEAGRGRTQTQEMLMRNHIEGLGDGVTGSSLLSGFGGETPEANLRAALGSLGLGGEAAATPGERDKALAAIRGALGFSPEQHLDKDSLNALSDLLVAMDRQGGGELLNELKQMGQAMSAPPGNVDNRAPGPQNYTVKRGDTLSAIAARSGVPLSDLIAANPQIKNPDLIYPGDNVTIPEPGTAPSSMPNRSPVGLRRAAPVDTTNWTPGTGDVTPDQIQEIGRRSGHNISAEKAREVAPHLNVAMAEANINTPQRKSAFIAQMMHESGGFRYNEEIASGAAYEGRRDLGNTQPGDGRRFKGRGYIQLTGRANYEAAGRALGLDLVNNPELAARPENASRVAAWYWNSRGLNSLADQGNFDGITRRINGGYNGKADRDRIFAAASDVLRDSHGAPSTGQLEDPAPAGRAAAPQDTVNMSTEEKYNHYRQLIESRGGTVNDGPGQRSLVGIRNEDHNNNSYDDTMAVIWRDEAGNPHVREFPANMESISRYQGRYGNDVNGDGRRDLATLAEGTYTFNKSSSSRYGNILRPANTTAVMRDTDGDGRGDTLDRTGAGTSILFHRGGYNDTGSAGCQTMPPDVFNDFWAALGNDSSVSYTVIDR